MRDDLLHILQHSLGVDKHGLGEQYRNRFVTGPGSDDYNACRELVNLGLMMDHGSQSITGGMHCFTVTDEGKDAMRRESPDAPKLSRSQERYNRFLRSDTGWSFKDWLKNERNGMNL